MTKRITIRMPSLLYDDIKTEAEKARMLPSEYIRMLLRQTKEPTLEQESQTSKETSEDVLDYIDGYYVCRACQKKYKYKRGLEKHLYRVYDERDRHPRIWKKHDEAYAS